jgi:hypothetical protein
MKLTPKLLLELYNKKESELLDNELEDFSKLTTTDVAAILCDAIGDEFGEIFSEKELAHETQTAYESGYEDGKNFYYGRTKADDEKVLELAKHIELEDSSCKK